MLELHSDRLRGASELLINGVRYVVAADLSDRLEAVERRLAKLEPPRPLPAPTGASY